MMRIRHICGAALGLAGGVFAGLLHAQVAQTPPTTATQASALTLAQAAPITLAQASPLTLAQALRAARNNVDVALARSAAAAAQADVLAADHAPPPTLSAKLSSIDLQNGIGAGNLLGDKRIDKGIGVDWTYERGNKRALRTQTAQRNASAAEADLEDTQMQQLLAASSAFFDLSAAQERVMQVQAIAAGTAQIATTAARRVSAGDLARQDALRLEIEAERAKGDVLTAKLERGRASLALASLLGAGAAAGAGSGATAVPAAAPGQTLQTLQTLQTQADWPALASADALSSFAANDSNLQAWVDARPDVRAATLRVEAARAAQAGASALKKADITWGVSFDHFPGTSTRQLELRLQMPLQFGYQFQGETARAQALLTAAQDALDKARRVATLDLHGLMAQLQSGALRSRSYEQDILPRAAQVAAQAEFAYTRGALNLADLLDARRTLRTTGLEALAARTDHAKAATAWRLRTQPMAALLAE